jgi:hypothetical protein
VPGFHIPPLRAEALVVLAPPLAFNAILTQTLKVAPFKNMYETRSRTIRD